jgi:uncharacterized protein (TIGR02145 family)
VNDTIVYWEDVSSYLQSESGWDPRFSVTWKDVYGFSALPNAHRQSNGDFSLLYGDGRGQWWTATESSSGNLFARAINYYGDAIHEDIVDKSEGWPVRCVRDD